MSDKVSEPRVGDVWESAGGMRRVRILRLSADRAVVESTRTADLNAVIGVAELQSSWRLIERYDNPDAEPDVIASLPRRGPTVLF